MMGFYFLSISLNQFDQYQYLKVSLSPDKLSFLTFKTQQKKRLNWSIIKLMEHFVIRSSPSWLIFKDYNYEDNYHLSRQVNIRRV